MFEIPKLKDPSVFQKVSETLNQKIEIEPNMNVEKELEVLQNTITEIKREFLPKDTTKKKSWMTREILELMKQRRVNKNNPIEYKRI